VSNSSATIAIHRSNHLLSDDERARRLGSLQFGRVFTDHMVTIAYSGGAWQRAQLTAYGPLSMDPATSALHYGQAIFEGYKAFSQPDGEVATFRALANAERFNRSAARLAMPALPPELFVAAGDAHIAQDRNWVPRNLGESLYLRPMMIATDACLGVRPSNDYLFVLIASPAGAYFPQGVRAVTVWISQEFVRAAPGGTGEAKCAGNYAASLLAQAQAQEMGCDQVVWLDSVDRQHVEEMGGMNLFFVYEDAGEVTLVTPALTGTLLPGITRDRVLTLARDLGYSAVERRITVDEWRADVAAGRMTEAFACGTAAAITPIGRVKGADFEMAINNEQNGPVTMRLREALLGIQHGLVANTHGWLQMVN
jgi:branched-chain amino acid aminotransferase